MDHNHIRPEPSDLDFPTFQSLSTTGEASLDESAGELCILEGGFSALGICWERIHIRLANDLYHTYVRKQFSPSEHEYAFLYVLPELQKNLGLNQKPGE